MSERQDDDLGYHRTPVASSEAGQRPWTVPTLRRLVSSAAEAGDTGDSDGIELPS